MKFSGRSQTLMVEPGFRRIWAYHKWLKHKKDENLSEQKKSYSDVPTCKVHTIFPEALSLVPSPCIRHLTTACGSSTRGSDASGLISPHTHIHPKVKKKERKRNVKQPLEVERGAFLGPLVSKYSEEGAWCHNACVGFFDNSSSSY